MTIKISNEQQDLPPLTRAQKRQKRDRVALIISAILIISAWIYGYLTSGVDVAPMVAEILPGASYIDRQGELYVGYSEDTKSVIGYAAVGQSPGYSGPIEILVGVDVEGVVTGVRVVQQRETPGFFRLLINADIFSQFVGKELNSNFQVGQGIDAISGATLSTEGVAAAARTAIREIGADGFDKSIPAERSKIKFGGPEIVLLLLFVTGYFGHKLRNGAWKQRLRWGTMIIGIVFLGFIYTAPLTITMITSFLSGYWPNWHNNLYWYFLIGGILFVTLVDGKNPYCSWFCPFGAVQETLASVSGAKVFRPKELHVFLTWFQRGLALFAILLGLALRRPGVAGFEPFATLFDFNGITTEWIFLGLILVTSLVVYRPFCNYLCPIDPTVSMITALRKWGRKVWRSWRNKK